MLVLDYACELQQMINAACDPTCMVLQPEGWVHVAAPYEAIDQAAQIAVRTNLASAPGPDRAHVELWTKWPGLTKARVIRVLAHCELSEDCCNTLNPTHVKLDEVEP